MNRSSHPTHAPMPRRRDPSPRGTGSPARIGPALPGQVPARTARGGEQPSARPAGGFLVSLGRTVGTVALTLPLALGLTLAATAAAAAMGDPTAWAAPLGYAALGLSALVGGILAARRQPEAPLAAGLSAGLLWAAILAAVALLAPQPLIETPWLPRLGLFAGIVGGHLLGAAIARPRPKAAGHPSGRRHSRR